MSMVTAEAGFPRRMLAYLRERYDPVQFVPFYLLLSFAVLSLFRRLYDVPFEPWPALGAVVLAAMLFAFYLLLRVMDEHKDWEVDRLRFPDRVLSRGLVTLSELRKIGAGCVLFVIGAAWWFGAPMVVMVLILLAYSLLMLKEFFAGEWLRRRIFLYAISHNVVVFLSIHLCFLGFGLLAGVPETWRHPDVSLAALSLNGLFFSLEVARKIRAPEREMEAVDTYSRVIGPRAAAWLATLLHVPALVLLAAGDFGIAPSAWAVIGAIWLLLAAATGFFVRRPTPERAEGFIKPVSMAFLAYLMVLIAM
jgi:4-hydroxybenzoate polyprenyltransferase